MNVSKLSLRLKVSLGAAALSVLLFGGSATLAYWSMAETANRQLEADAFRSVHQSGDVLQKIGDRVEAFSGLLAGNPKLIQVLTSGDAEARKAAFVGQFKDLSKLDPIVSSLEATDAKGVVQIRGHKPDVNGDDKSREVLVKSALEGRPARGLTVSPTSGEIAVDAVRPLLRDGATVGTLKVGAYFRKSSADEMKRLSGADVVFFHKQKQKSSTLDASATVSLPEDKVAEARAGQPVNFTMDVAGRDSQVALRFFPTDDGDGLLIATILDRGPAMAALRSFLLAFLAKCLAALLFIIPVIVWLAGRDAKALTALVKVLRGFQTGDYRQDVPHVERADEIGEIAKALVRFQEQGAQQNLTVEALNGSETMMMITDPEERIAFVSKPLVDFLMRHEATFRAARSDFSVENMTGEHIDYYRTNPNLRRELILDDGQVRKVRYDISGTVVLVDMTYVRDASGVVIGHTLVWRDMTAELAGQAEVAAVVQAAQAGDFSRRLDVGAKQGFVREIAGGLNNVTSLVERAVADCSSVMKFLASGDLTHRVTTRYDGALAELASNINDTIDRLSGTVGTIKVTAEEVMSAAREINSGANDLSQRTEQQASSLEETAATTEQLAASVKASAQSSRQAVDLSEQAMAVASEGGTIVRDAVEAMARIEQASRKISDITSVIDEIAFQTNLLALNAAVEAARAGEAGKGFAVVASEVRTLAQRSSEAAKDITGLIGASGNEVAEGVRLVRAAGEALGKIVEASRKVSATVSEISAAAGEQANGIDEMSQAVAHMDEMTQQNAALAEESAASAAALASQIDRMNDLVATFRIEGARPSVEGAWAEERRRRA